MSKSPIRLHKIVSSTGSLFAVQLLAMFLPLLTLPILARSLGVQLFGQIMLAQFVALFGVVFLDAGFNSESQRRVAVAADANGQAQALLDNLLARALLGIGVVAFVLLAGFTMPELPLWMVSVALLHVIGTLIFPQWWFVARQQGLLMGLAFAGGRLVSALVIVFFVKTPDDAWLALLCSSLATLLSGLWVAPHICSAIKGKCLDWQGYRTYLRTVRKVIFSGFAASSAQSVPVLLLGAISGPQQVGLFSAADRLTRAAAHLASVVGQSLLGVVARMHHEDRLNSYSTTRMVLLCTAAVCCIGGLALMSVASFVIRLVYGPQFVDSSAVLQWLAVWLGLSVFRNVTVIVLWTARGSLHQVAGIQWQEGLSVAGAALVCSWLAGAQGVAIGLVLCELALLLRICRLSAASRTEAI